MFFSILSDMVFSSYSMKELFQIYKKSKEADYVSPALLRSAQLGDANAQYRLAKAYENGAGVISNRDKAKEWLIKAAEQEQLDALYEMGLRAAHDPQEELKWFLMAAEKGSAKAQFQVGWLYYLKDDVKLKNQAHKWFLKAYENDAGRSVGYYLGLIYEQGTGVKRDLDKAFEFYESAANRGFSDAQYKLGSAHFLGIGKKEDPKKAQKWLKHAADRRSPQACFELSVIYRKEYAANPSPENLRRVYDMLFRSVSGEYSIHSGFSGESGKGSKYDDSTAGAYSIFYKKAYDYYMPMAEKGDLQAQNRLGLMLLHGLGCEQDREKAKRWLETAASKGSAEANVNLGKALDAEDLRGDWDDLSLEDNSTKYYKIAAKMGSTEAQYKLGISESSERYLLAAVRKGHPDAIYEMRFLCLSPKNKWEYMKMFYWEKCYEALVSDE